jgi:hypothetical protein
MVMMQRLSNGEALHHEDDPKIGCNDLRVFYGFFDE